MAESHDAFLDYWTTERSPRALLSPIGWPPTPTTIDTYLNEQTDLIDNADEYRIGPLGRNVLRDRDLLRSFAQT